MWFGWKNGIHHFATYGDKVTERGADFQKLDQCVKMPVDFENIFYYGIDKHKSISCFGKIITVSHFMEWILLFPAYCISNKWSV